MEVIPGFVIPGIPIPGFVIPGFVIPGFVIPGFVIPGLLICKDVEIQGLQSFHKRHSSMHVPIFM